MKHDMSHQPRTLVLCFDGTADEFDEDVRSYIDLIAGMLTTSIQNSNVVKFFSLLKKDDQDKQVCYYQARI
jgi:uncharacterized protein (DUF2235 family)